MSCKNCMGCCIHAKVKENSHSEKHYDDNGEWLMTSHVFDGYQHYCDKNPEGYDKWHEEHKHDTYDTYKDYPMDCYEPTESARLLDEMLELGNKILNNK